MISRYLEYGKFKGRVKPVPQLTLQPHSSLQCSRCHWAKPPVFQIPTTFAPPHLQETLEGQEANHLQRKSAVHMADPCASAHGCSLRVFLKQCAERLWGHQTMGNRKCFRCFSNDVGQSLGSLVYKQHSFQHPLTMISHGIIGIDPPQPLAPRHLLWQTLSSTFASLGCQVGIYCTSVRLSGSFVIVIQAVRAAGRCI